MLGPTKTFPRGHLNKEDEGALRMGVTHEGDTVKIVFGKPIAWFALPKADALVLAALIKQHADALPNDHPIWQ